MNIVPLIKEIRDLNSTVNLLKRKRKKKTRIRQPLKEFQIRNETKSDFPLFSILKGPHF